MASLGLTILAQLRHDASALVVGLGFWGGFLTIVYAFFAGW